MRVGGILARSFVGGFFAAVVLIAVKAPVMLVGDPIVLGLSAAITITTWLTTSK